MGGQDDVGHDACELGGGAVGEVELLDGELGGTGGGSRADEGLDETFHLDYRLHGAFSMGMAVADDDGAAIVLQAPATISEAEALNLETMTARGPE